ncbi:MAG: hypothetical protein U1E65_09240 [Myxococcota bacterium]
MLKRNLSGLMLEARLRHDAALKVEINADLVSAAARRFADASFTTDLKEARINHPSSLPAPVRHHYSELFDHDPATRVTAFALEIEGQLVFAVRRDHHGLSVARILAEDGTRLLEGTAPYKPMHYSGEYEWTYSWSKNRGH